MRSRPLLSTQQYNPGYFGDGSDAYTDANAHNTPFTIPGTTQRSIGDVLLENNISWKSYTDQWDRYLTGFAPAPSIPDIGRYLATRQE